eukprot:TRINITY_DN9450_c0_g2_i1.p1 TRINITY_DN9450_c0_g2~~TRINITY_DN9450_c0_g2_i1.p1  ORF type:complete len:1448 (-),score=175.14 TRINITY_DN9450_c0_g2_i1:81-4424(-)
MWRGWRFPASVYIVAILYQVLAFQNTTTTFTTRVVVSGFTAGSPGPAGLSFDPDNPDNLHVCTSSGDYFVFDVSNPGPHSGVALPINPAFRGNIGCWATVWIRGSPRSRLLVVSHGASELREMHPTTDVVLRVLLRGTNCLDMKIDPKTGDLFCSTGNNGILRIAAADLDTADADAGSPAAFTSFLQPRAGTQPAVDGISFAPNGDLYASLVSSQGAWPCGAIHVNAGGLATYLFHGAAACPDGAQLTYGADIRHPAHLVVNMLNGEMLAVDLSSWDGTENTASHQVIFTDGTRGDLSVVSKRNILYSTQTDSIVETTMEVSNVAGPFIYMGPGETTLIEVLRVYTMLNSAMAIVSARLTNDVSGANLSGATLNFVVEGSVRCTAVTDVNGVVKCALNSIDLGTDVQVTYEGSGSVLSSSQSRVSMALDVIQADPVFGPCQGGSAVTLSGSTVLPLLSNITIGSALVSGVTVVSATSVSVIVGSQHTCGNASVYLDGDEFLHQFLFMQQEVGSVQPQFGPAIGGTIVTIRADTPNGRVLGSGAVDDVTVWIGSLPCSVLSNSDTVVTCQTASSGAVNMVMDVTVQSRSYGNATMPASYSFVPQTLSVVRPNVVPRSGRFSVTIQSSAQGVLGNGSDITAVLFGTQPAVVLTQTNRTVEVLAPLVSVSEQLNVTILSQSYGSITGLPFTYLETALQTVLPGGGPLVGQNVVTVFGQNIGNGSDVTAVWLCDVQQQLLHQSEQAAVIRIASSGQAGTCNITTSSVSMHNVTLRDAYTFHPKPVVLSVSASSQNGSVVLVRIVGPELGNGSDIENVTVAGAAVLRILQQNSTTVTVLVSPELPIPELINVTLYSVSHGAGATDANTRLYPAGVLFSASPIKHLLAGGAVDLQGWALGTVAGISFAGVSGQVIDLQPFSFANESTVRVHALPAPSVRTGDILVNTTRGVLQLLAGFTYECDMGQYEANCSLCPRGHYCNGTNAHPCPPGSANALEGRWNVSSCIDCTPGRFANRSGMARCARCPMHSYCPTKGVTIPWSCPAGTVKYSFFGTTADECIAPSAEATWYYYLFILAGILIGIIIAIMIWYRQSKCRYCGLYKQQPRWLLCTVKTCRLCDTCTGARCVYDSKQSDHILDHQLCLRNSNCHKCAFCCQVQRCFECDRHRNVPNVWDEVIWLKCVPCSFCTKCRSLTDDVRFEKLHQHCPDADSRCWKCCKCLLCERNRHDDVNPCTRLACCDCHSCFLQSDIAHQVLCPEAGDMCKGCCRCGKCRRLLHEGGQRCVRCSVNGCNKCLSTDDAVHQRECVQSAQRCVDHCLCKECERPLHFGCVRCDVCKDCIATKIGDTVKLKDLLDEHRNCKGYGRICASCCVCEYPLCGKAKHLSSTSADICVCCEVCKGCIMRTDLQACSVGERMHHCLCSRAGQICTCCCAEEEKRVQIDKTVVIEHGMKM